MHTLAMPEAQTRIDTDRCGLRRATHDNMEERLRVPLEDPLQHPTAERRREAPATPVRMRAHTGKLNPPRRFESLARHRKQAAIFNDTPVVAHFDRARRERTGFGQLDQRQHLFDVPVLQSLQRHLGGTGGRSRWCFAYHLVTRDNAMLPEAGRVDIGNGFRQRKSDDFARLHEGRQVIEPGRVPHGAEYADLTVVGGAAADDPTQTRMFTGERVPGRVIEQIMGHVETSLLISP